MNKRGEKPVSLQSEESAKPEKKPIDLLANDDISRFDKSKKRRKKKQKPKTNGNKEQKQQKEQKEQKGQNKQNEQKQ